MVSTGVGTLLHARLLGGASQLAQIWFDAAVLDRYRGIGGRVLRTNTIGRLKLPSWSLDFGIADHAGAQPLLHVSVGEAQTRIPEGERAHWAAHAHTPALSANYVAVQLSHGTCIDDGDLRDW